jgi:protein-disulfide isomerase/uncharacterized membrane protein
MRWSAALGLLTALYLTWHYWLFLRGEGDRALCNVSAFVNCDRIAASSWSQLAGIPLSVWGAGGYLALLVQTSLALRARDLSGRSLGTLLLVVPFAFGLVVLPLVSLFVVRALCVGCAVSWLADLGLILCGIRIVKDLRAQGHIWAFSWRSVIPGAATGALGVITLAVLTSAPAHPTRREETRSRIERAPVVARFDELTITDDLTPSWGDRSAPVTIVYFTDFQCPYCRLQTEALRQLRERRPHDVRIIYRHFPLDPSCNPRVPQGRHLLACLLARMAIEAQRRGVFSAWSEEIWKRQESLSEETIRQIGRQFRLPVDQVVSDSRVSERLLQDLALADRAEVRSTPTLIINGKVFRGYAPVERLDALVTSLLTGTP